MKQLRAVLARPTERLIGLEGVHLVAEALRSGLAVETIFVRAGAEAALETVLDLLASGSGDATLLSVSDEVLRSAVTTEEPQPIAALAVPPVFAPGRLFSGERQLLLLVLAGVQDPGNVGTIIRSAEAFGASGVIALARTASVWNAKSLRAAMGSSFRLPVLRWSEEQAVAALREHGVRSLAAVGPSHADALAAERVDLCGPTAIWIGNEGAGLGASALAACDGVMTLPCPGAVESLNAAVAASVLLYEASRQRGVSGKVRDA